MKLFFIPLKLIVSKIYESHFSKHDNGIKVALYLHEYDSEDDIILYDYNHITMFYENISCGLYVVYVHISYLGFT